MPYFFNRPWTERFRTSSHLSVCIVVGQSLTDRFSSAATNDAADFFFEWNALGHLREDITVRETSYRRCLFQSNKSRRTTCHCWLLPPTAMQRLLKRLRSGLCRSTHPVRSTIVRRLFFGTHATRRKASTPP